MEFFLSFSCFKSRKKVTEFFFSGHASLSFHMMHRFPGTIFSLSVPTEILWMYISLTTNFNLYKERCRTHFSKYCKSYFPTTQINGFTYIMSETAVTSFPSYSSSEHCWKLILLLLLLLLLLSLSLLFSRVPFTNTMVLLL